MRSHKALRKQKRHRRDYWLHKSIITFLTFILLLLPVLKYYVANASSPQPVATGTAAVSLLEPEDQALLSSNIPVDFSWSPMENAVAYRFEVEDLLGTPVISAILPKGVGSYRTPSWFKDKVLDIIVRWRVIAFDQQTNPIGTTEWRALRFRKASQ